MKIQEAIYDSINYIEDHITEEITFDQLSSRVYYSSFHYQRLFQMMTGTTLYQYIRKRRMTLASKELLSGDVKVIDLAYKYQYDSPEAFSRAFKAVLGVSPSQVKRSDVILTAYPKLDIDEHETPLSYELVEKDAFYIKGYKRTFTAEDIIEGHAYSEFWKEKEASLEELKRQTSSNCKIGAGRYRADQKYYDALIGVFGQGENTICVEASRWCIFKGTGPLISELPKLWKRIFLEWFPLTDFQHSGKIELEVFYDGDVTSRDYVFEIWIPLSK
ncbi:helix-turn-helix domain-containing protein [Acidaminobacter sp. JC074]|uniref:AraC family transcriptional regulator n=1 Tax=Acidaminobacter sp. JC074 TaxID=2530199 RepID=UPI001F0F6ABE|nr:helix-turn-helix domain-containing protein [Acidaminobacter sp. JC074]